MKKTDPSEPKGPAPPTEGGSLLTTLTTAMAQRRINIEEDAEEDEDWSDDDWEP